MKAPVRKIRCAVYTRVSTDERLDMEFNSLDAQREAALAYIASQKHEGWILVGDRYDDGGFSGGTMERPALRRLLRDVHSGVFDVIVVYKVDRLSRSLTDFARIVEVFEKNKASFVSITQQFNTTTSMGRLTLNILLSFAQFEREVIGERIRDKFAASRRKGMWMGGVPPLGYDVRDRKLVLNETEAELVRLIFVRFLRVGSATKLARELRQAGHTTKCWTTQDSKHRPGKPIDKGSIYKILNNRVYLGEAVHKGTPHSGEHAAIIDRATWDKVHAILAENAVVRANGTRAQTPALLRGLIFAPGGTR
jgi:site-specific DNA recombinase